MSAPQNAAASLGHPAQLAPDDVSGAAPTHFDALIIGTGLRESILAAALARSGRTVLHIDEKPYYGDSQATLSLQELVDWSASASSPASSSRYHGIDLSFPAHELASSESTSASTSAARQLPANLRQTSRRYNLSLCPTLVTAVSPFVDTLVRSGVAKYAGFKLLDGIAIYAPESAAGEAGSSGGHLIRTAATKEDIFNDKTLSLLDKRKLVNFIKFATSEFESSERVRDHGSEPFLQFLESRFSLQGRLRDTIAYAASLSIGGQEDTAIDGLQRIRKYLKAVGRFGRSPFLLAQYGGIGEIIQGFCRVCAVFGGVYMLGRPLAKVTNPTGTQPASVRVEDEVYTAEYLIRAEASNTRICRRIHRAIVILTGPIRLELAASTASDADDDVDGDDAEPTSDAKGVSQQLQRAKNALFVIPPKALGDLPAQPVTALMAGEGTFSAPDGQYVLYLSSVAPEGGASQSPREELGPCLTALLVATDTTESESPPEQLVALYYSEDVEADLMVSQKGNLEPTRDTAGHYTITSLAEVCDDAVSQAKRAFIAVTGEEELFDKLQEEEDAAADEE